MKKNCRFIFGLMWVCVSMLLVGCHQTYHTEKVVDSIKDMCRKDYGINNVEVKIVGNTLGVHLPLRQLFSSDFEHVLATGKVQNLESLLQFSPEAMDKVEDVLFSTSRVILSTARPIDFYVLKASDTEVTGIELILIGYVQDIKRVRFWDISRNEYRDRVFHDLKVNRAVLWHRPIFNLFEDMKRLSVVELLDKYFISGTNLNMISPFFYSHLLETQFKQDMKVDIRDIRSTPFKKNESLVYLKVVEDFKPKKGYENYKFIVPPGYEAEYLFMVVQQGSQYRVSRVIPFEFVGTDDKLQKIKFPEELRLYQNIENWQSSFELEEVLLPEFLAQQLTRRVTGFVFTDERIENTLGHIKPEVTFQRKSTEGSGTKIPSSPAGKVRDELAGKEYFFFKTIPAEKDVLTVTETPANRSPEDIDYYLDRVIRLITKVLHDYDFNNFSGLEIQIPFSDKTFFLSRDNLEKFRKKKLDIKHFIASAS